MDLTGYATEEYVDNAISRVDVTDQLVDYAKKTDIPTVTNDLTNDLKSNYDTAYIHSTSTHAPTNAQKNSDITKAEIEAKLTGTITSHSHNYLTSIPSEYVTETELNAKNYTTQSYVDNVIDNVDTMEISNTQPTDDNITVWLNPIGTGEVSISEINDDVSSANTTWSSSKIGTELAKKSDTSHTHSNYLTSVPSEYVTESELGYVTPQMFGAKGDGATDDTVALQSAFTHVAKNGGYLFIPKGRYKVTSPITIDWGKDSPTKRNFFQKIIGAGSQAFEKYYDNSVIVGHNIPAYRGVIELIGSGNTWGTETRIEDLGIECDESSCDPMSFALMYGDARNFKLSRVKLRGHNGIYARCGSIVDENGNSATTTYEQMNIKFEQCDIYSSPNSTKGFAFLPEGVITGHYSTMDNMIIDSCLITGVWVITSCNIMFQSCHTLVNNVANKVITSDNVGLLNGYEIDYATGYYVAQAMNAVFQNCYFEDYRRGIHITPTLGNIRNVSIMNCYINPGCNQVNSDGSRLNADYGIRISQGATNKYVRNVLVKNNVFRYVEGDTEFVKAYVSNEFANHFVFRDNCTTSTQDVPKVINTTTSDYDIQNGIEGSANVKDMATSSDGKSFTIELTNGKLCTFDVGSSAPVKGVDYWTETDKEEIITDATAKVSQVIPLFVNSKDECTDKSTLYVLPDGMLYAYKKKESTGEGGWSNNLISSSTDTDGSIFNGKGYKDSTRLNSSGVVTGQEHSATTGFISCKKGDKFQLTGCYFGNSGSNATVYGYIAMYDANKTKLMSASADNISANPSTYYLGITPLPTKDRTVLSTDVTEIDLALAPDNVAFIRFSSATNGGNDYPILNGSSMKVTKWVEGTTITEGWESTGHAFVPADYESRIIALENLVTDLLARLE